MTKAKDYVFTECPTCKLKFYLPKCLLELPHIEVFCPVADTHWKIRSQQIFDSVPKETRQKILNLFRERKTLGEIKTELNLDLEQVTTVISKNIEDVAFLRTESL